MRLLLIIFSAVSVPCFAVEEQSAYYAARKKNTEKTFYPHFQIWADRLMVASLGFEGGLDIPSLYEDTRTDERNAFVISPEIGLKGVKGSVGYVNTEDLRFVL